jgi:hypothetical protein
MIKGPFYSDCYYYNLQPGLVICIRDNTRELLASLEGNLSHKAHTATLERGKEMDIDARIDRQIGAKRVD